MSTQQTLTTTFTLPDGRTFTVRRVPEIGNASRVDYQQDIQVTDGGRLDVRARKIPVKELEVTFNNLTKSDICELDGFYRAVRESEITFDMFTAPISSEYWQPGMTVNGEIPVCGDLVKGDSDDAGEFLECGRLYRVMDAVNYVRCRIRKGSYRVNDTFRTDSTVSMVILQELPAES